MVRAEALSLGLSVLNGQFHCDPQTLPITARSYFGNATISLYWRWTQGADLGGQGGGGADFPTAAPQIDDFDLLGVKLGQSDEVGWCLSGDPRLGTTEESCTQASSKANAEKLDRTLDGK